MKQRKRSEIAVKDTWDLESIYKSVDDFNKDYRVLEQEIGEFSKYKGHLLDSAKTLLEFLETSDKLERILYKLYYYAHLNFDVDTTNSKSLELSERVSRLMTTYSNALTFVDPELLHGDYNLVNSYILELDDLKKYKFNLEKLYRFKEHTLSEKEESILSTLGISLSAPESIYESLTDSDLTFGHITVDGERHEFTESNYSNFIENDNRDVRKRAFKLLFKTYEKYSHTIADTFRYNIEVQSRLASLRHFSSSLEASLYRDNIETSVYNNLIKTVRNNLNVLYDYYDLKKEVLKLDELHLYDIYANMVSEVDKSYTFVEAKNIVLEALSVLGDDYNKKLNMAFDNRYIDIYNNKGKRGGAYSSGFYDTNPFILLNFEGKYNDVTTLAHELGHSMHSLYSHEANPYNTSSYEIFVAEVASTVNELILIKYLIKKTNVKAEKLYLLNKLLELYKGTIFRQTMFAEFEKNMAESHENGVVLTSDYLKDEYYKLVCDYFGPNVKCDRLIENEWMRIPHFYYNFYVYKYAIGLSAASKIVHDIETLGDAGVKRYIEFLKTGGSMYPSEELKVCDVDVSKSDFIKDAIKTFQDTIEEFRKIYRK
ncbi:MAG: oligoendopeptidase F [Bacilli bacterium]|nr:oligoendopeptidase F [Bacilli bacterium]